MTQIKLRRDTSANFTSKNPVLGIGEPAYETDTKKLKIGDGTTAYTQLAYFSAGGGGSSDITATLPLKIVDGAISLEVDGQTIQIVDGKLHANLDELGNEVNSLAGDITALQADVLKKQDKLTAGENITISADNVISSTGGSAPSNMVTTDTEQTITGGKTFEGPLTFKGLTNWRGQDNNNCRLNFIDTLSGSASISVSNADSHTAMYGVGGGSSYVTYFQPAYGSTKFVLNNYEDGSSENGVAPIVEIAGNLQNKVNSTNYQILTQNNVTAGDNITITNTTNGISIAASSGGMEVKTASSANFNSPELLETGLYYISPGLNPQNAPVRYSVAAMLITMKWFSENSNQHIQQTWISCDKLVENQIYVRYSEPDGVMNSWVRVDSNKIASASALGAIKVGDGLSVSSDGTLSPSSKVVQLVESYISGKSGYRVYSDGYCEQWDDNTGTALTSITFLKPYKDTNYTVLASSGYPNNNAVYNSFLPHNKTTTGFSVDWTDTLRYNMWRAFGYVQI